MSVVCGLTTTRAFRHGDKEFNGAGELFDSVSLGIGNRDVKRLLNSNYITIGAIAKLNPDGTYELLAKVPGEDEPAIATDRDQAGGEDEPHDPPSPQIVVTEKGGGWYEFQFEGETIKLQGEDDLLAWMGDRNREFTIVND